MWGYNVIRDVVILHIKFLKYTLGVQKNTCNDMVYGDLGVCPLEVEIKVRIVKYWVRLITGKPGKLAYIMYQCLLYLDTVGLYTSPWLNEVRSVLNNCGMSGVWLCQEVPNLVWLGKAIQQRLKDQ